MKVPKLRGIIIPMVTPFKMNNSQDLDLEKLRYLVNFLVDEGIHGLIPCGGTGESVSLSPEENRKVIEVTVDEVRGRVPVIGGAKSPSTLNSLRLAIDAKEVGADGVMVQGPYYNHPVTEVGYYEHFKAVADEAKIPVLIYNLFRIQGENIPLKVISQLFKLDDIIGIKNTTEDFIHIANTIKLSKDNKKSYLQGLAHMLFPSLCMGSHGSITSLLSAVPSSFIELYRAYTRGNLEEAREIHYNLMPLIELGGSTVTVKAILEILGHPVGPPRKPMISATNAEKKKIKKVLNKMGLV